MEAEMLRAKLRGGVYALATLALLAPGLASAQPADKRTYFTFSGPVEMPGVALPAGQYEFRLANPDSSRNVIQVSSRDGKKSYGLFATHNAQRQTMRKYGSWKPAQVHRRRSGRGGIQANGADTSSSIPSSRPGASRSGRGRPY